MKTMTATFPDGSTVEYEYTCDAMPDTVRVSGSPPHVFRTLPPQPTRESMEWLGATVTEEGEAMACLR